MNINLLLLQLDIAICNECGVLFHFGKVEDVQYDSNRRKQKYVCPVCKNQVERVQP